MEACIDRDKDGYTYICRQKEIEEVSFRKDECDAEGIFKSIKDERFVEQ